MLARLPRFVLPFFLLISALLVALATYGVVSSQSANGVYDTDGDGLIEVSNLEQLDAIRHDTDGNGRVDNEVSDAYHAAFPLEDGDRVCRQPAKGMNSPGRWTSTEQAATHQGKSTPNGLPATDGCPLGPVRTGTELHSMATGTQSITCTSTVPHAWQTRGVLDFSGIHFSPPSSGT